jgi:2-keto-4-pentenoate hydratase/2-oxohepta-3-ene-1,7-dioic acid hydratase in catechol pathway
MPLPVIRYQTEDGVSWGSLVGEPPTAAGATVNVRASRHQAITTADILQLLDSAGSAIFDGTEATVPASRLLSPITADGQLFCQGLNYRDHAAEAGHHERKQNLFFNKASSSLSGPYADVIRPPGVELLDYEVEIGVIVRGGMTGAVDIGEAQAGQYIAGIVLCNDVSARDIMFGASFLQWFQGKSYRTFCPTGPVFWYLQPDEVASMLDNLEIKLWCNGELRQEAASRNLIYKPAETLAELSRIVDLVPGDLLLTGTPGGVIAQGSPKVMEILKTHLLADQFRREALIDEMGRHATFLKQGDVIRSTLRDIRSNRHLGGQETTVRASS